MITPPATIGLLGGGQLGRYFVMAARTMGYRTIVLDPDDGAPAGRVADEHLRAGFDDPAALAHLANACAVVTTEFENPPAVAMEWLAGHTVVRPSPAAVAIAQDRLTEKAFLRDAGIPIAPFAVVTHDDDLARAGGLTFPAILKTARLGYDGKGQVAVDSAAGLSSAWDALGRVACVLEQRLDLDAEVSSIVARSATGDVVAYPLADNTHVRGILDSTVVPSAFQHTLEAEATRLATSIAVALDYVGVLAVEMFVVDGHLLVNEIAPRPHNSGHWTLDAARTSQFAQQVRAVCGAALGDPSLDAPAVAMVNLLGDLWEPAQPDWSMALAEAGTSLHLYGKHPPRPARKMGHLTVTAGSPDDALALATHIRARLAAG